MLILKKIARKSYMLFLETVFRCCSLLPLNVNDVVFESFLGSGCNDSPRDIYDYIKKNYKKLNCYWSVKKASTTDIENKEIILRMSLRYVYKLARAKYIVSNSRLPIFFKRRKDQVYLQTWHGTPLKKLVCDVQVDGSHAMNNQRYVQSFLKEVNNWTYLVSPNQYSTNCFKSAFNFTGKILEYGYPRNQQLHNVNQKLSLEIRDSLGINEDDKVLLYTPTFRDSDMSDDYKYYHQLQLDLAKIEQTPNIKLLLRLHYLIASKIDLSKYNNVIDVSSYSNLNELFIASDCLVTDYSSTMFDYAVLQKPLILFPYDLSKYQNEIRGFYFDYKQLPGDIIKNTDELISIANNLEVYAAKYKRELNEFNNKFILPTEAEATELIVKAVFCNTQLDK